MWLSFSTVQATCSLLYFQMDSIIPADVCEEAKIVYPNIDHDTTLRLALGRLAAVEQQIAAMQDGFNRIQAGLQPALSQTGACGPSPPKAGYNK